jgi:predicted O-methyltransferase YrrM
MLFSIEFDPLHAAIATKIVEWAGLSQKVKVLIGVAETRIEQVKQIL